VAQLVSALTLPPRRLTHHELPMGGYADVTTRGHPEQVLPSQLVLEDLEFVRRFAANELLYFRREEPHARLREELVVLLDQGVRTWGVVRLVLSAAFFAFGKLAQRRKLRFQMATTGTAGSLTDPLEAKDTPLGALLEASDLSPHPGLALESVLDEPTTGARDVVLLTHPRSSREADVLAAARRVSPGTRLFAVTVDDRGSVELSELRHGTPVSLNRFRVDLTKSTPVPNRPERVEQAQAILPSTAWRGDVEPIGYPFRFGLPGNVIGGLFDFVGSGEWLMIACQRGMLYAIRTDGSGTEMLPRGLFQNSLLTNPEAVLGITGGFVVGGTLGDQLVAFYYVLSSRCCTAHVLGPVSQKHWTWYSVARARCVVVRSGNTVYGVDLSTKEHFCSEGQSSDAGSRVQSACQSALSRDFPAPQLHAVNRTRSLREDIPWPGVCLDPATGELTVRSPGWNKFTPVSDGRPTLKDGYLLQARCRNDALAIACTTPNAPGAGCIYVYRRDGALLFEGTHPRGEIHFTLSIGGRLLARLIANQHVEVRDVFNAKEAQRRTPGRRFHNNIDAQLGQRALLVCVGNSKHLIRWADGRLEHRQVADFAHWKMPAGKYQRTIPNLAGAQTRVEVTPELRGLLGIVRLDSRRFVSVSQEPLNVLVDCFGQIAILDRGWNLLCMFFVFRSDVAAWMPDGTRYGPAWLTGGPETPGAAEKIARRLQQAWVEAEGAGSFQFDAAGGQP
jgi:hypothetical protein